MPVTESTVDLDEEEEQLASETTPLLGGQNGGLGASNEQAGLLSSSSLASSRKKRRRLPLSPLDTLLSLHSSLVLHFHAHWTYLQRLPVESFPNQQRPTVMDFEKKIFAEWKAEVRRWLERGRIGGWVDDRGWIDDVEARKTCRDLCFLEEEQADEEQGTLA
jgi:hypothetical protein